MIGLIDSARSDHVHPIALDRQALALFGGIRMLLV
jgi:hypothetical protein